MVSQQFVCVAAFAAICVFACAFAIERHIRSGAGPVDLAQQMMASHWENTTTVFCLATLRNTWTQIRFVPYLLDAFLVGPLPKATELMHQLGRIYPPMKLITDGFLLYPQGTEPPIADFMQFLRHLPLIMVPLGTAAATGVLLRGGGVLP